MNRRLLIVCMSIIFVWALLIGISTASKDVPADVVNIQDPIEIYQAAEVKSESDVNLVTAEDAAEDMYNTPATEYASYQMYLDDHPEVIQSHEFKFTHYCGCRICCGKYSSGSQDEAYGCKGDKLVSYCSIATDPAIIPYGTELWDDEGNHYYASDTGSGVRGYHADLFVGNHKEAIKLGVQYRTLYWVKEDNDG